MCWNKVNYMNRLFLKSSLFVFLIALSFLSHAAEFKPSGVKGKDYSFQISKDFARTGGSSERFEVRHGDCNDWDCIHDRQRFERVTSQKYDKDDYWYSWSFYIPNNFMIQPAGTAMGQAKIKNYKNNKSKVMWMVLTKHTDYIQLASDAYEQKCSLIKIDDTIGKWTDIMIRANYSSSSNNPVDVWINGKNIGCNFKLPLVKKIDVQGIDKKEVMFRYGIYQTFLSRWLDERKTKETSRDVKSDWLTPSGSVYKSPDNTPFNEDWGVEIPTAVMYYDEIKMGRSRNDVNTLYDNSILDAKNPALKKGRVVADGNIDFKLRESVSHKKDYGFLVDSKLSRAGETSDRIEVRHGDCNGLDCDTDRQRYLRSKYFPYKPGEEYWYSGSFYLPNNFMIQPAGTTLIGNAILNTSSKQNKVVPWQIHSKSNDYIQIASHNGGKCNLIKVDDAVGKWVDYIVRADYSASSDKPLDVWINGRNVGCNLKSLVKKGWFRDSDNYKIRHNYGIYQTFVSRWLDKRKTKETSGDVNPDWLKPNGKDYKSPDNTPFNEDWGVELPTAVAYFDNIMTGNSRDEVNLFYSNSDLDLPPTLSKKNKIKSVGKYPNNLINDYGSFQKITRDESGKEWGYVVKEDITGSAPTKYIETFELRDGDCYESLEWSDCKNDQERSELMQDKRENLANFDYWYGWSIYFPEDFETIYPSTVKFGRFKSKKENFEFKLKKKGLILEIKPANKDRAKYKLKHKRDLRGNWHKIEVHAKWTKKNSGFFKVWIDGEQKVDYSGPTMKGQDIHFRYGISRQGMSKYKEKYNLNTIPTQRVFYSNVKRADSRKDLEP